MQYGYAIALKKGALPLLLMKGWAIAGVIGAASLGVYAVLILISRFLYLDVDDFSDE